MADGALRIIQLASLAGLAVSMYALHVEYEAAKAEASGGHYEALCDIDEGMSCSAVLHSSYGHILSHWGVVPKGHALDLPNALLGAVFYAVALIHKDLGLPRVLFLGASVLSVAFSLYLATVLKFVLHDACLVCITSYALNAVIFVAASRRALYSSVAAAPKAKAA